MGLETSNNATFINVTNGKICKPVKAPTDRSEERENKKGKIVHEEFYDKISGVITDITTRENEFGKQWMITLVDDEERFVLQLPYSSSFSAAFLKTLPNIDLSKRVTLIPSTKKEGEKVSSTMFVNQGGHALKRAYTKESPNGCPPMTQKKVKGKLTWDDSDAMEFLERMVISDILPLLKGSKKEAATSPTEDDDNDLI